MASRERPGQIAEGLEVVLGIFWESNARYCPILGDTGRTESRTRRT